MVKKNLFGPSVAWGTYFALFSVLEFALAAKIRGGEGLAMIFLSIPRALAEIAGGQWAVVVLVGLLFGLGLRKELLPRRGVGVLAVLVPAVFAMVVYISSSAGWPMRWALAASKDGFVSLAPPPEPGVVLVRRTVGMYFVEELGLAEDGALFFRVEGTGYLPNPRLVEGFALRPGLRSTPWGDYDPEFKRIDEEWCWFTVQDI